MKSRQRKSSKANKNPVPKTTQQYNARSARFQHTWNRVVHVIAKMRSEKLSLTGAAREVGVSPRAVTRWAKTALRKDKAGRYRAKRSDRLLRILQTPTPEGMRELAIRNSRQASLLGEYSAALGKYVSTGDSSDLERFAGVYVTDVTGARVPLLTDRPEIDKLASAGLMSFESLYSRS